VAKDAMAVNRLDDVLVRVNWKVIFTGDMREKRLQKVTKGYSLKNFHLIRSGNEYFHHFFNRL